MRKVSLVLAVIILLTAIAVPALAVEPRTISVVPSLSIRDDVATCAVRAFGNSTLETLVLYVRLYRDDILIGYWEAEGNGYIFFLEEVDVVTDYIYTMEVSLYVDDELFVTTSVDKDY